MTQRFKHGRSSNLFKNNFRDEVQFEKEFQFRASKQTAKRNAQNTGRPKTKTTTTNNNYNSHNNRNCNAIAKEQQQLQLPQLHNQCDRENDRG